ncbi:MAG: 30S ribosomal protein S6e [Candidatus Aenigmarchaeota archaeon]|nr:30S ribosomal protein S6e [Candidatus Aenigmarchaeota archaeon]
MAFKIVISEPKSKKAWQIEKDVPLLNGKKIGENFNGSLLGLNGFELQVTGGSDKDGVPMRPDMEGSVRRKALLTKGVGFRGIKIIRKKKFKRKGMKKRKLIRGNVISEDIMQINCKIVSGEGDVAALLGFAPKEEAPKEGEAPKEEQPKTEEKQEQPKEEAKPEEKKDGE